MKAHLKHFLSGRMTGDHSVPFHWLFHERWDKDFLAEYKRAKTFHRAVHHEALRRVFVVSYSCSGTHNFYTHFHYMPAVFAFGENLFMDREKDPFQFDWSPESLRPAHYLYGSAFLEQGLQEKRGKLLSHAFLLSNHYLKYSHALPVEKLREQDSLVFYQRNFLRVLFSQNRDGHKYKKAHFVMDDARLARSINAHRMRLAEMMNLLQKGDARIQLCIHERFCASPAAIINDVSEKVGVPVSGRSGWDDPEAFFKRCYRSGSPPLIKDGKLWSDLTGKAIFGKGGEYNPLPAISLERTISAPIKEWYTGDRLAMVRKGFGEELVDFWLEDQSFDYATATQESLTGLLERGVVAGQDVNAG